MVESNSKDLFGRLMLSIEGTSLSNKDKALISNPHVGGIIFFSKNFISRNQISDLCNEIKSIKKNIILAVDHEGGRVQRFKNGFTKISSMQSLGDFSIKNSNYDICNDAGWLMSSELMAAGIDISFAPVLDLVDWHSDGHNRSTTLRKVGGLQLESLMLSKYPLDIFKRSFLCSIHDIWAKLPQDLELLEIGHKSGWRKISKKCKQFFRMH